MNYIMCLNILTVGDSVNLRWPKFAFKYGKNKNSDDKREEMKYVSVNYDKGSWTVELVSSLKRNSWKNRRNKCSNECKKKFDYCKHTYACSLY